VCPTCALPHAHARQLPFPAGRPCPAHRPGARRGPALLRPRDVPHFPGHRLLHVPVVRARHFTYPTHHTPDSMSISAREDLPPPPGSRSLAQSRLPLCGLWDPGLSSHTFLPLCGLQSSGICPCVRSQLRFEILNPRSSTNMTASFSQHSPLRRPSLSLSLLVFFTGASAAHITIPVGTRASRTPPFLMHTQTRTLAGTATASRRHRPPRAASFSSSRATRAATPSPFRAGASGCRCARAHVRKMSLQALRGLHTARVLAGRPIVRACALCRFFVRIGTRAGEHPLTPS
jgi:hypothetical protein